MIFNSLHFLIFFPVVVALYFGMSPKRRWILLLIASYYFYMSWKAEYAILILISTVIDYFCGLKMGEIPVEKKSKRKKYLYLSLLVNLGLLFSFKYFNFFNDSVRSVFDQFNIFYDVPAFQVLLPVGISFYTFQTLSYTIDIYRGELKPTRHFGKFALFVSFFPQLVAGPIERAKDLLPQFDQHFEFNYERVKSGLLLMCWGFFKKLVIADRLAIFVNMVFEHPEEYFGLSVIIADVFFFFQVYCDFSGYSDIAIGGALVLGFKLMENFRRPFLARSVREFWKRWHISLSYWLRDYIYISLGGSRVTVKRQYINLMILFSLCGLWHGASWTFVAWGVFLGSCVIVEIMTSKWRVEIFSSGFWKRHPRVLSVLQIATTFSIVSFSILFFRAETMGDVWVLFRNGLTLSGPALPFLNDPYYLNNFVIALFFMALMEGVQFFQEYRGSARAKLNEQPAVIRWMVYSGLIFAILNFGILTQKEFIYFQF